MTARALRLLAFVAPLLGLPRSAPAAESSAQTKVQRFALIVGSNDGGSSRTRLRFAGSDAQAVARVLGQLGGLRPADEIVLLEPRREAVLSALSDLSRRVEAARAARQRTEVIVYYSGHSDESGLLPAGEQLGYSDLRGAISRVGADVRIAILDSCSAGAFTRRKGGVLRPPFLVDDSVQVRGHAYLASSSESEAAQESDRIRGSFFTHYLVTGLRGAADVSGDGRVTLNEAYTFAFNETLAGTEKTMAGAQHPAYDIEMAGTGDVVMTDLHEVSAGLTLPRELSGRLYVRDASGALAAELGKAAGGAVELGLDPGSYRVVLEQGGKVYQTDLQLSSGHSTVLAMSMLTPTGVETTVRRGPTEVRDIPFNLSLFHPLSTNAVVHGPVRNRFSVGVLHDHMYALSGLAVAGVFTSITGPASGLVADGVGSYVGGDLRGVAAGGVTTIVMGNASGLLDAGVLAYVGGNQYGLGAAGAANVVLGEGRGVLAAGVVNVVRGGGAGLHVSGVANVEGGDFSGLQLSVVNVGGNVDGAQIGVINVARRVRGLQLGLINVADTVDRGGPLGLLSIVRHNGMHSVEVAATDIVPLNVHLKLGARHVFGILGAGLDPFSPNTKWSYSAGIGIARPIGPLYLEGDLITTDVQGDIRSYSSGVHLVSELRVIVGWPILPQLAIFGGVSGHVSVGGRNEDSFSGLSAAEKRWVTSENSVRLGPGFVLGVRAF